MRKKAVFIMALLVLSIFAVLMTTTSVVTAAEEQERECNIGQAPEGYVEACAYFNGEGDSSRGIGATRGKANGNNNEFSVSILADTEHLLLDSDDECYKIWNIAQDYGGVDVIWDVRADPNEYADYCISYFSEFDSKGFFDIEQSDPSGFFSLRSDSPGWFDGLFFSSTLQETSYTDYDMGGYPNYDLRVFDIDSSDTDYDDDDVLDFEEIGALYGRTKNGYPLAVADDDDTDDDGLDDYDEMKVYFTNPQVADTDYDALDDDDEVTYGCNPLMAESEEFPYLPDGLTDGEEIMAGTYCWDDDTDGDGLPDGSDYANCNALSIDADGDCASDLCELNNGHSCVNEYDTPPTGVCQDVC
jgi:hypothetical protein